LCTFVVSKAELFVKWFVLEGVWSPSSLSCRARWT
jgi:hypothetical protein